MKILITALVIVLLIGSTSFGGWYVVQPTVVQAYYPGAPAVYAGPAPYVSYMPVATPAPYVAYAPVQTYAYSVPVVAPAPILVGRPAVVRTKVFYPGQPVRNVVKVVVP
jgi:hypothetical protein